MESQTIGTCLACGKIEVREVPKDLKCPICGDLYAPATIPLSRQAVNLGSKSWLVCRPSEEMLNRIEKHGLVAVCPSDEIMEDLTTLTACRADPEDRYHLYAHRHVYNKGGLCNGDLKNKQNLIRALTTPSRRRAFAKKPRNLDSPSITGKLIEAEFTFRAENRELSALQFKSSTILYVHELLQQVVVCEIDFTAKGRPGELKTVSDITKIEDNKLFDILMQLGGEATAKGVDKGFLVIAERNGNRATAIEVSGLKQFHLRNLSAWLAKIPRSYGGFA